MDSLIIKRKNTLFYLFGVNLLLLLFLLVGNSSIRYFKSSVLEYSNITSDPFDGTIYPIAYVPNWLKSANTNKSLEFASSTLDINQFVEIPKYDLLVLQDTSAANKQALLARYTYPVVYMGNYKLDYEEYAGSHLAVDIRAPIGTPVLSVANWVVIKVKNTESWDGKYVVIRHDNVKIGNSVETIYSSYEHLSEIVVDEWTKISKWDVLWKVWMTWITTTPHLHFQIDKKAAPSHPYWPYTFKEASNLGLDFFSAINAGLGKENAISYTINPMEFTQENLNTSVALNSAPDASDSWVIVKPNLSTEWTSNINTGNVLQEEKANNSSWEILSSSIWLVRTNGLIFNDISKDSEFYEATKYLYEKGITKGYDDFTFRPDNTLTRQEAIIFIFKLYNVKLDWEALLPFNDISKDSFIAPYLQKALDSWLISRNTDFRPDDIISRAEFVTILVKASGKDIFNTWNTWFNDIKQTDWYSQYVETFARLFNFKPESKLFEPNSTFNRWQIAQILYSFVKNR